MEDLAIADLTRLGRGLSGKRGGLAQKRGRPAHKSMAILRPEFKEATPAPAGTTKPGGLIIIQDTREQAPMDFSRFQDVREIQRGTLRTGDYSLAGQEDVVAIERKELGDLINCLSHERARFERELARAVAGLRFFAVVCEGAWEDVARGRYRSRMTPESALQSILALSVRYRVPFIMAGSRKAAEYIVHGLLRQYARQMEQEAKIVTQTDTIIPAPTR